MSRKFSTVGNKIIKIKDMDKPYEFAQRVAHKMRYLRKLNHLSQEQVANKLFMGQTTYSKYERGCLVMNGTLAKQLAIIYNVPVSYLLDDSVESIAISEQQYKTLLKARDIINEIEKARESANNEKEDIEYAKPKTKWKNYPLFENNK